MLISGSPTSSPISTRSLSPFSSFNFPLAFPAPASGQEPFAGSARGTDGLDLLLRFSFCDDLFFSVMGPFLPDDITFELLLLSAELQPVHHARPLGGSSIVIVLATFFGTPD